jgi:hypothetical protein
MISSSSSTGFSIFPVDAKLTGEFTSLEEPTDDSDLAEDAVYPADRPKFIKSERRIDPREPT